MSVMLLESEDVAWFRDDLTGARRAALRLAERIGLSEHRSGEVALAVSEAASNLAEHAVAGEILLRVVRTAQQAGVEILATDSGPGMADVTASMPDGRSTTNTLGIGLGMIARLADTFDLHSAPEHGTVMLARFWPHGTRWGLSDTGGEPPQSVVEGVTRPINGEHECGDGWAARWDQSGTPPGHPHTAGREVLVMLCDGLGHGPLARLATQTAIRAFHAARGRSPQEIMREIHEALSGTRGAAVAVARIEPDQERVLFCGVGNIAGAVLTPTSKSSLPSLPGTAGYQIRTPRTFTHPLPSGGTLVMHSDGLTDRWDPATVASVLPHSPAVIACHLLHSAGKYHDDASVAVAKGTA